VRWDLGGTLRPEGPQRLGGLDRQHIGQIVLLQEGAQAGVAAVDLIGGHPPRWGVRVQGARQHLLGQLRLGRKADTLGHVCLGTTSGVGGPLLGQVQLPVHQRPPLGAGVGQEDADLAVLDPPGGAGVLTLHPRRLAALLQKPRLVHHQHPARVTQVLHDVAVHVIAQPIRIPTGAGQQPLHPIRRRLPSLLGQLPAVLARHITQQPPHEPGDSAADLRADKPRSDPLRQPLERRRPALHLSQYLQHPPRSASMSQSGQPTRPEVRL
jgi:hypothetical protein